MLRSAEVGGRGVDPEDERSLRQFLATIHGLVRHIDDAMGRIIERLDLGRTLVCFTSDHGDYSGHRGLRGKLPWIPFDGLARVPLVIAGSGVQPGVRTDRLVQSFDLVATCLDHAGAAPPSGLALDSVSLRPFLTGAADLKEDRAVFCRTQGIAMVRRGDHKLITRARRDVSMLFDLADDPDESQYIRGGPHEAELQALLDDFFAQSVAAVNTNA